MIKKCPRPDFSALLFGLGSCVHYPSVLLCHLRSIYVKFDTFSLLLLARSLRVSRLIPVLCSLECLYVTQLSAFGRRTMCRKIFNFLPFFSAPPSTYTGVEIEETNVRKAERRRKLRHTRRPPRDRKWLRRRKNPSPGGE